jgi:N-carbamoyl-L-amino-acid hydrolase
MAGTLGEKDLAAAAQSGMSVRQGIEALGGDPAGLAAAARRPGEIAAYLEIHIEQGGTLDARSIPVGVVEGIVGIARWDVAVDGFANHAGTTPMDGRRDALLAAARFVLAVNRIVTSEPGRQVGTVGRLRVEPGAVNVIPGRVELSLELRDLSLDKVRVLFAAIRRESETIARETGTAMAFAAVEETPPALTDARLRDLVRESAQELGLDPLDLPSGAGHDAQAIARIAPIGMIFVRSVGGISHSPREFSAPEDIVTGADVLLRTLLKADRVF